MKKHNKVSPRPDPNARSSRRDWLGAAGITGLGAVAATMLNPETARAAGGTSLESFASTVDAMGSNLGSQTMVATAGHTFAGDGGAALWRATGDIDGAMTSQVDPATLRFYDEAGKAFEYVGHRINVLAFGAQYGDASDKINEVFLSGSGHFFFPAFPGPAGVYEILHELVVPSNTKIELASDAVVRPLAHCFVNGIPDADYSQYNAHGNIEITGGTFFYWGEDSERSRYAIGFSHGKDITITNVKFLNSYNGHNIEINACQNVRIENCVFEGEGVSEGSGEMLQFDGAFTWIHPEKGIQHGYHVFGAWDGTPCDNCLVTGCTFIGGTSGVGTHATYFGSGEADTWSGNRNQHRNIRIIGNSFSDQVRYAIRAENWVDSIVSNNNINRAGVHGVNAIASSDLVIEGNVVTVIAHDELDEPGRESIRLQGKTHAQLLGQGQVYLYCERVTVRNNQIRNSARAAFLTENTVDCSIVGNHVTGAAAQGVLSSGCTRLAIEANRLIECGAIAVELRLHTSHVVIKGNLINKSFKEGIKAVGAFGLTIIDNVLDEPCVNTTNCAIRIADSDKAIVHGNVVRTDGINSGLFYWALFSSDSNVQSAHNLFMEGTSGVEDTSGSYGG